MTLCVSGVCRPDSGVRSVRSADQRFLSCDAIGDRSPALFWLVDLVATGCHGCRTLVNFVRVCPL